MKSENAAASSAIEIAVRLVISLAILSAAVGIFLKMGVAQPRQDQSLDDAIPTVEIANVVPHNTGIPFTVDGVVVPHREIQVAAEVAGRVKFKAPHCRTGQPVKKGDLLLEIDPQDYQIECRRLDEEVKQAESSIQELQVEIASSENKTVLLREELTIRTRELDRYLKTPGQTVFSQSEIDAARRNELSARNAVQSQVSQSNLLISRRNRVASGKALAETLLEKAQLELTRTSILAPLNGVVVDEHVEEDGFVQKGTVVLTVQETADLDVTCQLQMSEMHWLWQAVKKEPGTLIDPSSSRENDDSHLAYEFPTVPVEIAYRFGTSEFVWRGELNRYDGAGIDRQTRLIPCRAHVTDPRGGVLSQTVEVRPPTLMTGMFVSVRIVARPNIPLLRIPHSALRPGSTVWAVRDSRLLQRRVRVAQSTSEGVIIYADSESPQAGDQVIVSPLASPVNGTEVSVRQ